MSSDVPDWVRIACNRWGRQKRRVWSGKDWHGNVDGYAQSLLGRIRDERDGAGQGVRAQFWPEVFWGDGLEVQRALTGMPEMPLSALHVHYIWDPEWNVTAARKAKLLNVGLRSYWDELKKGEYWIFARLDSAHDQVREITVDIPPRPLQKATKPAINTSHPIALPRLSFAALSRERLSIKSRVG